MLNFRQWFNDTQIPPLQSEIVSDFFVVEEWYQYYWQYIIYFQSASINFNNKVKGSTRNATHTNSTHTTSTSSYKSKQWQYYLAQVIRLFQRKPSYLVLMRLGKSNLTGSGTSSFLSFFFLPCAKLQSMVWESWRISKWIRYMSQENEKIVDCIYSKYKVNLQ